MAAFRKEILLKKEDAGMKRKNLAAALILLLLLAMFSGCAGSPGGGDRQPGGSITIPSEGSITKPPEGSTSNPSEVTEPTDPSHLALCKEIEASGRPAGMAFLGYVGESAAESDLRSALKSGPYAEKYAFLADAPLVDAGGAELYAVVTAAKDCRASVYRAQLNKSGTYDVQTAQPLYEGAGYDCFLLRCNVSDIHSNAAISFADGTGTFSVYPMLSGADGRLVAEGCHDFSLYPETEELVEDKNVQIARELLAEAEPVRQRMAQGMVLLYTGERETIEGRDCWVFALGTDHDGQFVREALYGVCDNLIYTYDVIFDQWSILGAE